MQSISTVEPCLKFIKHVHLSCLIFTQSEWFVVSKAWLHSLFLIRDQLWHKCITPMNVVNPWLAVTVTLSPFKFVNLWLAVTVTLTPFKFANLWLVVTVTLTPFSKVDPSLAVTLTLTPFSKADPSLAVTVTLTPLKMLNTSTWKPSVHCQSVQNCSNSPSRDSEELLQEMNDKFALHILPSIIFIGILCPIGKLISC